MPCGGGKKEEKKEEKGEKAAGAGAKKVAMAKAALKAKIGKGGKK